MNDNASHRLFSLLRPQKRRKSRNRSHVSSLTLLSSLVTLTSCCVTLEAAALFVVVLLEESNLESRVHTHLSSGTWLRGSYDGVVRGNGTGGRNASLPGTCTNVMCVGSGACRLSSRSCASVWRYIFFTRYEGAQREKKKKSITAIKKKHWRWVKRGQLWMEKGLDSPLCLLYWFGSIIGSGSDLTRLFQQNDIGVIWSARLWWEESWNEMEVVGATLTLRPLPLCSVYEKLTCRSLLNPWWWWDDTCSPSATKRQL